MSRQVESFESCGLGPHSGPAIAASVVPLSAIDRFACRLVQHIVTIAPIPSDSSAFSLVGVTVAACGDGVAAAASADLPLGLCSRAYTV